MRPPHNNNNRRQRGNRPHNGNGGSNSGGGNNSNNNRRNGQPQNLRNQIFDSHGPNGERVRGNAFQVHEKYLSLARDAEERIDQENYYQHAEHYYRIVEAIQEMEAEQRARFTVVEQPDPFGQSDEQPDIAGMGDQPSGFAPAEQVDSQRPPRFRDRGPRPPRDNQQQPERDAAPEEMTSGPSFSLADEPSVDMSTDELQAEQQAPRPRTRRAPASTTTE